MTCNYRYSIPKEESFVFFTQLKGHFTVHEERPNDDTLDNNLKLAEKINKHVNQTVLYCPNYPSRNGLNKNVQHKKIFYDKVLDMCKTARTFLTDSKWYLYVADLFSKFRVGTCGSMAIMGAAAFKEEARMSLCIIPGGNHEVIRIGEGQSAVICDPWMNCYYPEDRAHLYLRDVNRWTIRGCPLVSKTDKKLKEVFVFQ